MLPFYTLYYGNVPVNGPDTGVVDPGTVGQVLTILQNADCSVVLAPIFNNPFNQNASEHI